MQNHLIWNTLVSHTRKGKFLPVDAFVSAEFSGSDTKELFEKNLKTQPLDWEYRTKNVKYTINKDCYRAKEFNKVDWNSSIVVFGCSNVFGVGLDDSDTVCSVLEKITGVPVVNLGVGGSSINFSLHNSAILSNFYPTPLAVVHLWTEESRCVYYTKRKVVSYGAWNNEENSYADKWIADEYNYKTNAMFASLLSQQDRKSVV